jgi:hypothetical protein
MPPEQFGEKIPSLSLFPLNMVVRGFSLAEAIFPLTEVAHAVNGIETQDYRGAQAKNETSDTCLLIGKSIACPAA